jgi:DNA-directed RNA polymerase specialized sigma24 family protein
VKSHEIEQYANAVFGFCLRRLNNIEDARDLSQEILCEALKGWSQAQHPESWLWQIARNRYSRHIRIRKEHTVLLDDGGLLDTLACETPGDELREEKQAVFVSGILRDIFNKHQYKSDSVHPNAAGYAVVAEHVYEHIKPYLKNI